MAEANEIANRTFDQVAGGSRNVSIPGSHQELFEWNAALTFPVYKGVGAPGLSQSAPGWLVKKYVLDGTGAVVTSITTATGTWSGRADLTYT